MAKKATVGERIELNGVREALCRPELTIDGFRTGAVYAIPRKRAKAIDRAIRKAAKDAAKAERGRVEVVLSGECELAQRGFAVHAHGLRDAVKIVRRMK